MNEVYKRIEAKAIEKGWNMADLCRQANVPKGRLSDFKNGKTANLSQQNIQKLANALCTTTDALLYGENDRRIIHVDLDSKKLNAKAICNTLNDEELVDLLAAVTAELQKRKNSKEG